MTPPPAAPDLSRGVLGYRVWEVTHDGWLRSAFQKHTWAPGINEALCGLQASTPHVHEAPAEMCTCGLYCFNSMADLAESGLVTDGGVAVGTVAAWGPIELSVPGMRARFMRILALAPSQYQDPDPVVAAAQRYRVPCVDLQRLDIVSLPYAPPAPATLIPFPPLAIMVIDCGLMASQPRLWQQIHCGCAELVSELLVDTDVVVIGCGREIVHWTLDHEEAFPPLETTIGLLTCADRPADLSAGIRRARLVRELHSAARPTDLIVVAAELPADPARFVQELDRTRRAAIRVSVAAPMALDDWPTWLSLCKAAEYVTGADLAGYADVLRDVPQRIGLLPV